MLGKMQVEGEKQKKYDQGFAEGLNENKQMIIDSLCTHIQLKFGEDIKPFLENLTIEKLIQLQGSLFTANTIEEIKELIKG